MAIHQFKQTHRPTSLLGQQKHPTKRLPMPRATIPLLKDHHSHPLLYAAFAKSVQLQNVRSKSEAERLIREAAESSQDTDGGLIVANGWRSNLFQWTDMELEQLPPVAIFNLSLHSLLLNQGAREILIGHYGAAISNLDDRDWYESNLRVVWNWFANLCASADALTQFYAGLLSQGVCYAEEMLLVDERETELFEEADLLERTKFWAAPDTFCGLSTEAKNRVHGLKLFTDGAIGSRTAAMKRPFLGDPDDPSNFGMLIYSDEDFLTVLAECFSTNKSLAVHAIGDRAIEQVIVGLEESGDAIENAGEIRIEHAQMIDLNLAQRAKTLGVKLSMQPNFTADSVDYTDRLDVEYCRSNNPFRMLIDQAGFVPGKDLIFGSDGMPHGVEFATEQSFRPSLASQRLTIDEFVAGYCWNDESWGTVEVEY